MPHFAECPWCNAYIWDWFAEWYLEPEKTEVGSGRLAMDCPHPDCRRPVLWIRPDLHRAPEGTEPVQRPIAGAEEWATNRSQGYPDLVSFLTNPGDQDRAKYFRSGYWPEINV
jgi:hypothetical protein